MAIRILTTTVAMAAALAAPALAQTPTVHTVTVVMDSVRSGGGEVFVALCTDKSATFPGECAAYKAKAKAAAGSTTILIPGVAPGVYALQALHDENGDGRFDPMQEGYALGNNAGAFSRSFAEASVKVEGNTTLRASMRYGIPSVALQSGKKDK